MSRAPSLIVLAACAQGPRSVPITIGPAHELIVPVVVNGEQIMLQLDTGASTTTIAPAVRTRLKLPPLGHMHGIGAAGRIGDDLERTFFTNTEIGEVPVYRLLAVVLDLGGASDGLLGMDALKQVISEVDLAHDRFSIYSATDRSWLTPDLAAVPYTVLAGGQIAFAIAIDGHTATAILDLGANQSFANELAFPARDDTARLVTAAVGADGHPWRFRAFGNVALAVGAVTLVAPNMLVADLPIFAELALANRPAVILGADLLAGRRLVIDPIDRRVYFSKRAR